MRSRRCVSTRGRRDDRFQRARIPRCVFAPSDFRPRMPTTARAAFLVSPTGFSLAAESATDNRYMAMRERAQRRTRPGRARRTRRRVAHVCADDRVSRRSDHAGRRVPEQRVRHDAGQTHRRRDASQPYAGAKPIAPTSARFSRDLLELRSRRSVGAAVFRRTDRLARHRPRAPHRFLRIVPAMRPRRRARHARGVRSRAHLLFRTCAGRIPHQRRARGARFARHRHRARWFRRCRDGRCHRAGVWRARAAHRCRAESGVRRQRDHAVGRCASG